MHEGQFLKDFIEQKPIKVTKVVELTGIKRPTIYTHFNKQQLDTTIKGRYKDAIGIDWLDKKDLPVVGGSNAILLGEINYPEDESPYTDLGNGKYLMVVPLVPIRAQAGYIDHFEDSEYIESTFDKHYFTVDRQYRGKYMAFVVDGDSMDNDSKEAIVSGSIVTGRDIQRQHWRNKLHLHRFQDYIIVHKDNIVIKRITNHNVDKGIITCHSLNENKEKYPDFDLYLDDCLQILNIVNVTQVR